MKTIKIITLALITSLSFTSCSNDDDNNPEIVIEEEIITTMNITLTPDGGGDSILLTSVDLDGDGPNPPVITGATLAASTTYNATIELLNELENPAENITEEVAELDEDHQFFFTANGVATRFTYSDEDVNGNPLGLSFAIITTTQISSGTITVTLVHEPNKDAADVNEGDITNAGGETDIEVTFPITIQ